MELKLKWTKHCVLASAGIGNTDANSDNIIFIIKHIKSYIPVVTLSAKDNQKCQNILAKGLKDQFIGINIKQKVRLKT